MAVVAQVDVAGRANVSTGQHFYVGIAVACLAVAVIGFAPTYWLPLLRGTLDVRPIFHVHAAVFYGWTLLFTAQAYLVANTAYWAAGGALVALQLLRVPLSTTDAWARIAVWLSTLSL